MVRDAKLTRGPALQPLLRVHCISVGHGQCAAVRRWSLEGRTPYSVCRAYSAVPCGLDDMVDVFFFLLLFCPSLRFCFCFCFCFFKRYDECVYPRSKAWEPHQVTYTEYIQDKMW